MTELLIEILLYMLGYLVLLPVGLAVYDWAMDPFIEGAWQWYKRHKKKGNVVEKKKEETPQAPL